MNNSVFVYGTLQFPQVMARLTGRRFGFRSATLYNYRRYKIFDGRQARRYPAIAPCPGSRVGGKILTSVDAKTMTLLDFFEDSGYRRESVMVFSRGRAITAYAYVWKKQTRPKLQGVWNAKKFQRQHLPAYLDMVQAVRRQWLARQK